MSFYLNDDNEIAAGLQTHQMTDFGFSVAYGLGHRPAYWTRGRVEGVLPVIECPRCGAQAVFDEARSVLTGPALFGMRCPMEPGP
jgi:hypothetical protein